MEPTFISALNCMRDETKEHRSYVMSRVHSKGTKPEIIVRKSLFKKGFRYRLNVKELPGSPDIVLPKYHTVIFVHGCFWHGHENCDYYSSPKSNVDFWKEKIKNNQKRDQEVWRQLEAKGWSVIIIWECQLKKALLDKTISCAEAEIRKNGEIYLREMKEREVSREAYRIEMKARKRRKALLKAELESYK